MPLTILWKTTDSLGLGENESFRFRFAGRANISFTDDLLGGSSRVPQQLDRNGSGCRKFHLDARVRCHFPRKGSVHIYSIFLYWSKFGTCAIVSASGHPLGYRNYFYDEPWHCDNFRNNFVANNRGSVASLTFSKRSSPKTT